MLSKLILTALISLVSFSAMAAMTLPLKEIKTQEHRVFSALMSSEISTLEKIQMLQATKALAEDSIQAALLENTASASDIANPESEIAQAFQTVDVLTILSQLKIENGEIAKAGCLDAKAMIQLALVEPEGKRAPSNSEAKTIAVLKALCK